MTLEILYYLLTMFKVVTDDDCAWHIDRIMYNQRNLCHYVLQVSVSIAFVADRQR